MRIRVLMFGPVADAVGRAEADLEVPEGAVLADVPAALALEHSGFDATARFVLAVNARYVPKDVGLKEGDEVAVIPPVSGG